MNCFVKAPLGIDVGNYLPYAAWIDFWQDPSNTGHYFKFSQWTQERVFLADSTDWHYFRDTSDAYYGGAPGSRHFSFRDNPDTWKNTCLFVDGHVEALSPRETIGMTYDPRREKWNW